MKSRRRVIVLLVLIHLLSACAGSKLKTTVSVDPDYRVVNVKGWALHIHNEYLNGDRGVLDNALDNAAIQLGHIETLLPANAVTELKRVPIWITPPGKRTAEYHWERSWLIEHGRNPEMVRSVQITDITILDRTRPAGPWVLMHEMAHAYHDRVLTDEDDKAVKAAWDQALAEGKYRNVLHLNRHRRETRVDAYAATRYKEYFAECVEAYFGVNDFYPFVRPELREYDPQIYAIIKQVYGDTDD